MEIHCIKKISIFGLCLFVSLSGIILGKESPSAGKSIHLTFRVLGWRSEDVIGIKYFGPVSKEQIHADTNALALAHDWTYFENTTEITSEKGAKITWQSGSLSETQSLAKNFTLNFQVLRELFPNAESIIIDIIGQNGFAYQGTFTSSGVTNENAEQWQSQFPFKKNWVGMSGYRIRYTLHPTQLLAIPILPTLSATASFSKMWLFKTFPLLVFLTFAPSATLYLFVRRGVSRNELGKVKLSPIQGIILNLQFPIIIWVVTVIGCANVFAMLTRNAILGFMFGGATVPILSYMFFLFVLHRNEKNSGRTTWSFRENLLTNLRMIVLGTPAILLPFCFLGTQKMLPHVPFFALGLLLLVQYAMLTALFACMIPFALRWVWNGKPLKDETLGQRLHKLAQKAGIDYRGIVLLKTTGNKLANAWVAGILPRWRTVFITDYLLEHLRPEEIETIFSHELGHLKHRHLLKQVAWIVLGFGGQLLLVSLSLFLFRFLTGIPSWAYWLLFVSINFGVILLLVQFGLMPFWRRMEFEADAYAVELTQQPTVFLQALRKVIQLNDAPEDLDTFNEMLSTHPNFKARADAIEKINLQQT